MLHFFLYIISTTSKETIIITQQVCLMSQSCNNATEHAVLAQLARARECMHVYWP